MGERGMEGLGSLEKLRFTAVVNLLTYLHTS